nr:complement receptor type 2-like [Pelodiscus sinensis]|eukprot:XP_025034325.1 complement receptor type 2-like [Pelodiscus sinensis]
MASLPSCWTLRLLGTLVLMLLPGGALSECRELPTIPNAVRRTSVGTLIPTGKVVTYNCRPGYKLIGGLSSGRATCNENSTWSFIPDFCQKVRCPALNVSNGIENSTLRPGEETYAFGDIVTIECDSGYGIKGTTDSSTQIRCQQDGTWDPAMPVCEPACGQPPNISHGQYNVWSRRTFVVGSLVTYKCDIGFSFVGQANIHCLTGDEGTPIWSEPTPECEEIQCPAPHIENGILKSPLPHNYTYRTSVTLDCNIGYILRGNEQIQCQMDGKWYPPVPVCDLGRCPYPPVFDYADRNNPREFLVGTTVTYSCKPGYTLIPGVSPQLTCQTNFKWPKVSALCQRVRCPTPVIENGKQLSPTKAPYMYANRVGFQCNPGYILKGREESVCRTDGMWYPPVPFCDKACGRPPSITSGHHNGGIQEYFSYGSQVTYSCGDSLSLVGEASIYCTLDGENLTWSRPAPQCKMVRCPRPVVGNGRMTTALHMFTYGVTVEFSCEQGYLLHGSRTSRCQGDSTWNPPVPSCQPVQCARPDVQYGRLNSMLDGKMWYNVNESLAFKCSPGYHFPTHWDLPTTDSSSVTCLANGNWSALPKCKKLSNSEECAVVQESKRLLDCDVPLTELRTLLELNKLYLENQKLKREIKKLQ